MYRPVAFFRVVRPVAGSPRIRVRLRPITAWGQGQPDVRYGSNHIRMQLSYMAMLLSTDAPIGLIAQESAFRLEPDLHFFLVPDESFSDWIGRGYGRERVCLKFEIQGCGES